ncbi:MAG TPA: bacillithiol biosynthesis deacetylase BshB1 [Tepidisphaeraceae bacterium]|jgi:bacillithiol biosynthesis deacetylase BshB1|nr:bacillithiol biosynthesis deacetylase BshB1 [Tepidisphaeraceae bacterium]
MASILVIGPHPDDQELGMGGSIAKLAAQGHHVHLLDMTNGEPTPLGSVERRARESAAAAKILGVSRSNLGLPNREVVHGIEARHKLAAVIRVHRPNWMFLPYPVDAHPDHVAVTRIGEDARFDAKLSKSGIPGEPWYPKRIIYYYCTHLKMNFDPLFFLDVSETMEKKIQAIQAYESQFVENNSPVVEMLKTMNGFYGGRIGTEYAEPFFSHEAIGFGGLDQLI